MFAFNISRIEMKVLLITQYFYPENFKSNDIAFELVKRGYEVDALVGIMDMVSLRNVGRM